MTRARDVADTQDNTGGAVAPFVAGKNAIINGDFNIWQRGTTFSNPNVVYTADRWLALTSGTASRSTDAPTGFLYSLALTHTSPSFNIAYQRIEAAKTISLTPTITLSLWAKKTSGTDDLQVAIYYGSSVDSFSSPTFFGQYNLTNGNFSTSWTRYTLTVTLSSAALANGLEFRIFTANSSANGFRLTGVQLESGNVATPFTTATGTLAGELAACQRYYWRQNAPTASTVFGLGWSSSTTVAKLQTSAPVTMRVAPTSVDYANLQLWDGGATYTISSFGLEYTNQNTIGLSVSSSSMTAYRSCAILSTSTSGYLGFSAEL